MPAFDVLETALTKSAVARRPGVFGGGSQRRRGALPRAGARSREMAAPARPGSSAAGSARRRSRRARCGRGSYSRMKDNPRSAGASSPITSSLDISFSRFPRISVAPEPDSVRHPHPLRNLAADERAEFGRALRHGARAVRRQMLHDREDAALAAVQLAPPAPVACVTIRHDWCQSKLTLLLPLSCFVRALPQPVPEGRVRVVSASRLSGRSPVRAGGRSGNYGPRRCRSGSSQGRPSSWCSYLR